MKKMPYKVNRRIPKTPLQLKEDEYRKDPVFAAMQDELEGPDFARSFVSDEFIPSGRDLQKENDRL